VLCRGVGLAQSFLERLSFAFALFVGGWEVLSGCGLPAGVCWWKSQLWPGFVQVPAS